MKGSTLSGLGQTACPLRMPATLAAASVACGTRNEEGRDGEIYVEGGGRQPR